MEFKDYFSRHAQDYANYRPGYPQDLFDYLANLTSNHSLAWDCATGNGQAATALADYFAQVVATDASHEQINCAIKKHNVQYRVLLAEQTDFEDHSIDLITVASAVHWFNLEKFYREVKRVLKSQGILAIWTYSMHTVSPEFDKVSAEFDQYLKSVNHDESLNLTRDHYKNIAFPFERLNTPNFQIVKELTLVQLFGYLKTWSRFKNFLQQTGKNPLEEFENKFIHAWGDPNKPRLVYWPLYLVVGEKRVNSSSQ